MTVSISPAEALLMFVSLLSMFSPPAVIGPLASIIGYAPRDVQRRIAWRVARNYALVVIATLWLGRYLLTLLGIAPAALTATGGAALLFQGWPLMTRAIKAEQPGERAPGQAGAENWDELASVPLLFPLTIGGGTVAVVVAASSRFPSVGDHVALTLVALAMIPVVAVTFLAAGPVAGRLRPSAMEALARVSGIVLVALAMQLLVEGLTSLVASTPLGAAIMR